MIISRRASLILGTFGLVSMQPAGAQSMDRSTPWVRKAQFMKDVEQEGMRSYEHVHEGKGTTGMKVFRFDRAPAPANFLVYEFPPGASEGVHVHRLGDRKLGSFDEFYYIVSGSGQMEIDGRVVPVKAGDHVFTPLDVFHGIENTSTQDSLKVFLTYIERA
jgi:mannose-6-phosphate isomerase-like protein (cupin superfamily)